MKASIQSVEIYLTQLREVVTSLSPELIDQVVDILLNSARWGNKIYIIGNGGGAATASHFACDLTRHTCVPRAPRLRAIALADNVPLLSALADETDYDNVFAAQLRVLVEQGDVVIGFSCNSNASSILNAMAISRQCGAITVAFTGNTGGRLQDMVDLCIRIPSQQVHQQEDAHLILTHCICTAIQRELVREYTLIPSQLNFASSSGVVTA